MVSWSLDSEFIRAVHLALKRYNRARELAQHPLTTLAVVEELRHQRELSNTPQGRAAALREAFDRALNLLEEMDKEQAELLRNRFWRGESVVKMALERGMAESTFYCHQEKAIQAFAFALWELERIARLKARGRQQYLQRNLPAPTYSRLFGVDEALARLQEALTRPEGPWLISIEGLGGLGKTALVHSLASWAASTGEFADIVWETVPHPEFSTWDGIIEKANSGHAFDPGTLLDSIAAQIDFPELLDKPSLERERSISAVLKSRPYLVVVDDFGFAANFSALIPRLRELANPTRFLLTSHRSLCQFPYVFCLTLKELEEKDAFAFMRYESQHRGILQLAEADEAAFHRIYAVTGGNPLAIKLVVSQARHLPLERILRQLQGASGRPYRDLYRFVYQRSWELLSEKARKTLLVMPTLVPGEASWEKLQAVTGLDEESLNSAIRELMESSLLYMSNSVEGRYAIHRLTYTFIAANIMAEWA